MIEAMFYFFVLLGAGILCLGIWAREAPFIFLSAVIFIGLGLLFGAQFETLKEYNGFVVTEIDANTTNVDYNYLTHKATLNPVQEQDIMLWGVSQLFLWGGIVLILLAIREIWANRSRAGE